MGKKKSAPINIGFIANVRGVGSVTRGVARRASEPAAPSSEEEDAIAIEFLQLVERDMASDSAGRVRAYTEEEAAEDNALLARIRSYAKS